MKIIDIDTNPIKNISDFILHSLVSSFALLAALMPKSAFAQGLFDSLDSALGSANGVVASVFFFDLIFWTDKASLPLLVAWLVIGAGYFTFKFGFINLRGFKHAIDVVRGKYTKDSADDDGEVSHFQALTAALSATVGLGNIAGVAIAVSLGGPGATFWMIVAGLLGMSSKFTECTAAVMYREVRPDGHIMGGAMEYLSRGLAESGLVRLGKFLAVLFCILCVLASFGGGNAFQVRQSFTAFNESFPILGESNAWVYGLIMAIATGVVIIGGIKSIAKTAERIVPFMCALYVGAALFILLTHFSDIPWAVGAIISGAFDAEALYGGFIGVLVTGFQRAAFSNEAGIGSAAIAHSAAKTKHAAREGYVALLEPFIDTVVICTMTALVIIITKSYNNPEFADIIAAKQGAALTSKAFGEKITWFPYILSVATILFAYSTMISWSYYGERCWTYMFGEKLTMIYRLMFVVIVFFAASMSSTNILDFSDLMLLGMAFPNLFGLYMLSSKIKGHVDQYQDQLKNGGFS